MERPWTSSQSPLLARSSDYAGDGSVDLHGHPVRRSLTGRWRAAFLIIGVEIAERLAYVGIASNMITYLTDVLHETTATAAKNVNNWAGVTCVLPIFGAFIADSYLGRFLDRATVEDDLNFENTKTYSWRACTVTQVEEVKLVLRLIPIWVACLMYGVTLAQSETLFTKQGSTMDRKLSAHFLIPPAALQILISLSIIMLVPMYDCIFVPLAKSLTGNERGITLLQRIGIGMAISTLSMIVAALTEVKRLKAANDNQLVDMPHATIPMSIFWLLPQYILFGIADVFTMVGLQEYFYDQMPDTMRSLGAAAYLSVFGTADFLSSILISVIEKLCRRRKERSWFADNLNKAHLDYFYWLLATLSALNLFVYISFARCFIYKKVESNVSCDDDAA